MKRRDLITTALGVPYAMLIGCAGLPAAVAPARDPAKAQLTVLYEAFGRDPRLQKDWGYAAFIEAGGMRILFDTGNNPEVLAKNAAASNVDLTQLDFVVMSHRHGDHMGGMTHLLRVNPKVRIYAPKEGFGVYGADLPSSFYRKDESLPADQRYFEGRPPDVMRFGSAWPQANIALVDRTMEIAPGIHLISLVSDKPGTLELRELSLCIETPEGMVVVVGCSHTGIDNIVKAAASIRPRIQLVAGGFHLVVAKDPDIDAAVTSLRDTYKVARVAPGHCSGEPTFTALKKSFGDRCLYAGLGSTLAFGGAPRTFPGIAAAAAASGLSADDLQGYRALFAKSSQRRRGLFTDMPGTAPPGGAYLAQWRHSMVGCC